MATEFAGEKLWKKIFTIIKLAISHSIENSVIDKEHDQNKISASIIASGERNDNCMTQSSAKPQMKMLKIVKNPLLKRMKIL